MNYLVFPKKPSNKDADGIYRYPYLDNYWKEKDRFPYILYYDDNIAGFALVRKDREHWEIAEFYVLPRYRRFGIATVSTAEIFTRHHGYWEISFNKNNQPGGELWQKVAERFSKGEISNKENANHVYLHFHI
jgi:predicted acetyltransferase